MNYEMIYAHSDNDVPGFMNLEASTDDEAMEKVRTFVSNGLINGTWGGIGLSDGSDYICRNHHGKPNCSRLEPVI